MGFPQPAVLQALLQHGSGPWCPSFKSRLLKYRSHRQQLLQPSFPTKGCSNTVPAPVGLSMAYASFRPHPLLCMGSSIAAPGGQLCVVPMGCKETACSTMSNYWAAGNCCSSLEHLLPQRSWFLRATSLLSLTPLPSAVSSGHSGSLWNSWSCAALL